MTTTKYLEGIDIYGWKPFNGKLWQRCFYDRIIRNDNELEFYRYYIKTNPENWEDDEYFIERVGVKKMSLNYFFLQIIVNFYS